MLDQQAMWNFSDSEPNLDIQYNTPENSAEDSDSIPLARQRQAKRKQIPPIKITPDKLSIVFGDKTSVLINKIKQVARKTLMTRAPEPRGTLKPLWNIIPDGTITYYTPTTISIDTHNRANTRIRKHDLAIATETYQKPTPRPHPQEPKPRLMHFAACKTLREYNRNKEKIGKFCLEEKRQLQMHEMEPATPAKTPEERSTMDSAGTSNTKLQQQAGPSNKKQQSVTQKRRTERKRKALSPSKRIPRPSKNTTTTFEQKSKEVAIAQTKLTLARKRQQQLKQKQHPLIHRDLSALSNSKTIELINLASDSSKSSPMRIVTSSTPKDFMTKTLKSPTKSPKRNIDIVVELLKANNQAQEVQTKKVADSDTDYANIVTIKKTDPPKTTTQDNIITQQNNTTPHPQLSSTPIQQDKQKHPQTAEHDSTSDIENEPQPITTTTNNAPQPQDINTKNTPATKTMDQSPISSDNTEDMEELNKLIFD